MKRKIYLATAIVLLGLFFLFTALVLTVDLQPIGPSESKVGFATINGAFKDAIGSFADTEEGYSKLWYNVSGSIGFAPILIALCFAILGLCQAIKRKSILKVDPEIIILGAFYVVVFAAYLGFEIIPINFRPVLMDGELEASYPSSHTILAACFSTTAIFELSRLLRKKKILMVIADVCCGAIGAAVIACRLLSGVHWLSDIIAGILLSAALVCFYRFAVLLVQNIKAKKETTSND